MVQCVLVRAASEHSHHARKARLKEYYSIYVLSSQRREKKSWTVSSFFFLSFHLMKLANTPESHR